MVSSVYFSFWSGEMKIYIHYLCSDSPTLLLNPAYPDEG
jgi:hypothetical protein